ncbi:hypothetical protein FG05_35347 [Fusarium graminearum]|nr:hypothetical protein FG05_35347 [Fusarium graminearum]
MDDQLPLDRDDSSRGKNLLIQHNAHKISQITLADTARHNHRSNERNTKNKDYGRTEKYLYTK